MHPNHTVRINLSAHGHLLVSHYYYSCINLFPGRTAPEALTRAKFSTASDVWSYGVVLWEIYSLCKIPWDRLSPIEIRDLLLRGERLARPSRCPLDMYEVMLECWEPDPHERPTFTVLVQRLESVS